MGLSEVVDISGKKANFSQTCSLLSQFLKEKGSFGELSLGLSQNLEHKVVVPTGTMDLLPIIEKSGQNQAPQNSDLNPKNLNSPLNMFHHLVGVGGGGGGRQETMKRSDIRNGTKLAAESAPLTIFYAGQVIVFNDFPADKANEIMMQASKSSAAAAQNHHLSASAPPVTPQSPTESATSFPNVVPSLAVQELAHRTPPPPPQFSSDLPIARKNSLARFLEKRKDRTTATEPYPTSKLAAPLKKAAENSEAWLRLGPRLPSQIRRN